jgi:hypothetical protein
MVDLDGTVLDWFSAFLDYMNSSLNLSIKEEDITDYLWFKSVPGLSEEMFWRTFENFGRAGGYRNLKPFDGSVKALWTLAANGYDLWYVTKRPSYTKEDTKFALENLNLPFHKQLRVVEDSKSPIVNELSCDAIIDDSPSVLTDLAINTRATIYCMDSKVNRFLDDTWLIRVKSWAEFLDKEAQLIGRPLCHL